MSFRRKEKSSRETPFLKSPIFVELSTMISPYVEMTRLCETSTGFDFAQPDKTVKKLSEWLRNNKISILLLIFALNKIEL